jgi:UDP-glucose 4-epimerase
MAARRILITGVATHWGGALAQTLEADPAIDAIVGVDREDPVVELERTEFVRVGAQHRLLGRILRAARIDTVIDTRMIADSATATQRAAHENNVIATIELLAACSSVAEPPALVFKSSAHWYGCDQDDPAYFTEDMPRRSRPQTAIERDIIEAEAAVAEYAERHPATPVAVLRFANVLGPGLRTSHTDLLGLPAVPAILGFDPRYQFVHEDDVVGALEHAARERLRGIYNCAGDGVLAWSEVCGLLGKLPAPILAPWGTGLSATALRALGIRIPPEMLRQLRFGRALDNRALKATGLRLRFTTRETVLALREHQRLRPLRRRIGEPYRYEREVEEFLRRSPAAQGALGAAPARAGTLAARGAGYDALEADEVVAVLDALDADSLAALRAHEAAHAARPRVIAAIDALIAGHG